MTAAIGDAGLDFVRREFLKKGATRTLAFGLAPALASCGGGSTSETAAAPEAARTEQRTYYFDLSDGNASAYTLHAGSRRYPLSALSPQDAAAAKRSNSALAGVDAQHITHAAIGVELPRDLTMCIVRSGSGNSTAIHRVFHHVPSDALDAATAVAQGCGKSVDGSLKPQFQACLASPLRASAGTIAQDNVTCTAAVSDAQKDAFDMAVTLVSHHPEVAPMTAAGWSYVQQTIICPSSAVMALALSIYSQGPATVAGGWATLIPVRDATGTQELDSTGQPKFSLMYSSTTLSLLGAAINAVLPLVKDDPQMGADLTGVDMTQPQAGTDAKVWFTRSGTLQRTTGPAPAVTPARAPSAAAALSGPMPQADGLVTTPDVATGTGVFTARPIGQDPGLAITAINANGRTITFTLANWYLRWLGLYVQFLDESGGPILLSTLGLTGELSFMNGTTELCVALVSPGTAILGISAYPNNQAVTIDVPAQASSFLILAGGLGGSGPSAYPATVVPGAVLTGMLNLCIPGVFLMLGAASGLGRFQSSLNASLSLVTTITQALLVGTADITDGLQTAAPDRLRFLNALLPIASTLWKAVNVLKILVAENVAVGEGEAAVEDAATFGLGFCLQAAIALETTLNLLATAAEVSLSPFTYVYPVTSTNTLPVTLKSSSVSGFPTAAKWVQLTVTYASGTPVEQTAVALPPGLSTFVFTLTYVPAGPVSVLATLYADEARSSMVGIGTGGSPNATAVTVAVASQIGSYSGNSYSYDSTLQVSFFDNAVHHAWSPVAGGPAANVSATQCAAGTGALCTLQSLHYNRAAQTFDYVWQSSWPVPPVLGEQRWQAARAPNQLLLDANFALSDAISVQPTRAAFKGDAQGSGYYLDIDNGRTFVRPINLTSATFTTGATAYGYFNYGCDSLALHGAGKLVSLNIARSRLEVMSLGSSFTTGTAPSASVVGGPGTRVGRLNVPVCVVVEPGGNLLVLEQGGLRIQALDFGGNPVLMFKTSALGFPPVPSVPTSVVNLVRPNVSYLDLAVEPGGYLHVLYRDAAGSMFVDVYSPANIPMKTTSTLGAAAKITVDENRTLYTLDARAGQRLISRASGWIATEPTLSRFALDIG